LTQNAIPLPSGHLNHNFISSTVFHLQWTATTYLGQRWLQTIDMVGFRTLITEHPAIFAARFAAHDAIPLSSRLISAFVTEPIAIGDVVHGWFEAVSVIALVAAIAK
jgi:hypothetical protein